MKIMSGYGSYRRYVLSIGTMARDYIWSEYKQCFVIDDDQEPLISQFMIGDETNSSSNGSFFENIKYKKFKVKCVFVCVIIYRYI